MRWRVLSRRTHSYRSPTLLSAQHLAGLSLKFQCQLTAITITKYNDIYMDSCTHTQHTLAVPQCYKQVYNKPTVFLFINNNTCNLES